MALDELDDRIDSGFSEESGIVINETAKQFLAETSKWTKFLAIVGFVMIGFILIAAIVMVGVVSSRYGRLFGPSPALVAFMYVAMGVLYFFPTYYLFMFAKLIREGVQTGSVDTVTRAFGYLKSMFKFVGILTIVILGIYILIFLFAFIASM